MVRKLFLAVAVLGALTSCKKPTLADKLEGTWQVNDISANGTITVGGQTLPVVADDKTIDPTSVFTLVNATKNTPSVIDYNFNATMSVNAITQVIDFPFSNSGSGSWLVKEGEATVLDSVIVTAADGTTTRYAILLLNESLVRLRTRQIIDFQGQGVNAQIEFGFIRQE
jgi:hypothetical protein